MDTTDDFRYTDEEIEAFKSIMRLERGFRTIVSACTGDVRHLLALINKVCVYMRDILRLAKIFPRFRKQHADFDPTTRQN